MKNYNLLRIVILLIFIINHGVTIAQNPGLSLKIINESGNYLVKNVQHDENLQSNTDAGNAIQTAIDLLSENGGHLKLTTGTYPLRKTIILKSRVNITGEGFATIIDLSNLQQDTVGFYLENVNAVTIEDLSFKTKENDKPVSGILADASGSCTFEDLAFVNLGRYGIWMRNDCFLSEIRGCRFANINESGIFLENLNSGGRGGDFVPNLITNSIFYRGGAGIECKYTIVLNIIGCLAYQTSKPAFYMHSNSNSILINGCRTFQIEDDAVMVDKSDEINITGNIFCWHDRNGIVLSDVTWGTVSGNNIIDTGNRPFTLDSADQPREYWKPIPANMEDYQFNGIELRQGSRGLTITGNAVFNWNSNPPLKYGIYEDESCHDNLISSNNINYFTAQGVLAEGKNTMAVNNLAVEEAHKGNNQKVHSFDPRVIERFIEEIGL